MTKLLAAIYNPAIKPSIGNDVGNSANLLDNTAFVIKTFIVNGLIIGYVIGAVSFLFMLIWGSLEYVTAGGDKEKTGNAQKRITNAIIGLVLLFSVFAIVWMARNIFGINILNLDIPIIT